MLKKLKSKLSQHKGIVAGSTVGIVSALSSVSCFAAEASGYIKEDWVSGLVPNVTADVGTMMPIGIGIMALFLGVRIVPKIVYSFMG